MIEIKQRRVDVVLPRLVRRYGRLAPSAPAQIERLVAVGQADALQKRHIRDALSDEPGAFLALGRGLDKGVELRPDGVPGLWLALYAIHRRKLHQHVVSRLCRGERIRGPV